MKVCEIKGFGDANVKITKPGWGSDEYVYYDIESELFIDENMEELDHDLILDIFLDKDWEIWKEESFEKDEIEFTIAPIFKSSDSGDEILIKLNNLSDIVDELSTKLEGIINNG